MEFLISIYILHKKKLYLYSHNWTKHLIEICFNHNKSISVIDSRKKTYRKLIKDRKTTKSL